MKDGREVIGATNGRSGVPPRRSVFGFLLGALLPGRFLREYGADLVATYGEVMAEAKRAGRRAGIRMWLGCVRGVVAVAWHERTETLGDWLSLTNRITRRMMRPRQGSGAMQRVFSDATLAVRSFRRRPGFALTALFLLALGIGATTTIFSVVDGVLLRPLPYPAADRLVYFENPAHSTTSFRAWRDRTQSFEAVSGVFESEIDLTGSGDPVRLHGAKVTLGVFDMFGAHPLLGRFFDPEEFVGPPQVAVLGYRLWQDRFGGDPGVLGQAINLNGAPVVVVGVVESRFGMPEAMADRRTEIYVPFDIATPEYADPGYHILTVVARLRPPVSLRSAQTELHVVAEALAREYPDAFAQRNGKPQHMSITTLQAATVGGVGGPLFMLLGAVGFLLLIAVANVANLFLARGTDRAREMALRTALGADRRRLIGQLMTESILLAVVGGCLGLVVAIVGIRAFEILNPGDIPMIDRIALNVRVLLFAFGTAGVTGVLFGLAPAWQSARVDVNEALKDASSGAIGQRKGTLRNALIIAEVAVALILLAGAGLLFNSFLRLQSVSPGFQREGIAILPLVLDNQRYTADARGQFTEQLIARACRPRRSAGRGRGHLPVPVPRRRSVLLAGVAFYDRRDGAHRPPSANSAGVPRLLCPPGGPAPGERVPDSGS